MSKPCCLTESDQCDAVLCALVIDVDFDGQKEVLLGTYGQVRQGRTTPHVVCRPFLIIFVTEDMLGVKVKSRTILDLQKTDL